MNKVPEVAAAVGGDSGEIKDGGQLQILTGQQAARNCDVAELNHALSSSSDNNAAVGVFSSDTSMTSLDTSGQTISKRSASREQPFQSP